MRFNPIQRHHRSIGRNGIAFVMRAMIDQGSQASIITERAAQLLQLDRNPLNMPIKAVSEVMAGTDNISTCSSARTNQTTD